MFYDIYHDELFLLNNDGSLEEYCCSTISNYRRRVYTEHDNNQDQVPTCMVGLEVHGFKEGIKNVVMIGLANGQIGSCQPKNIYMFPVQAHSGILNIF